MTLTLATLGWQIVSDVAMIGLGACGRINLDPIIDGPDLLLHFAFERHAARSLDRFARWNVSSVSD